MTDATAPLTDTQKVRLLQVSRQAIFQQVSRGRVPPVDVDDERLKLPGGAFCSLHIRERMRGCIGTFEDGAPLYKTVIDVSVGAATRDERFGPMRLDEVPRLDIELSVLSPMTLVSPDEVIPGTHGLFITVGRQRGTMLPQVAPEFEWDREELLSQTCTRAGLEPDAWRAEGCRIEVFTAEVFSESELRGRRR
ncbi:MAG: AmmeMemoRadiSam system protein A [Myxococcota bacterium]|jgi:AmmeMemoRadiSam system protein A